MNKFLSDSYDDLEETLTHTKSLKLKNYPGEKVTYFCAGIFKPGHLEYITHIFEDTSNSSFYLWAVHKYTEVIEFIN